MNNGAGIGIDIDFHQDEWEARVDWLAGDAEPAADEIRKAMIGTGVTWLEAAYMALAKAYRVSLHVKQIEHADQMSLEELQKLKKRLYEQAVADGLFNRLRLIYDMFADYYSGGTLKKSYRYGALEISHHDKGIMATIGNKMVAQQGYRGAGELFVPGAWAGIVDVLYDKACAEAAKREIAKVEAERAKLIAELQLT